MVLCLWRGKLPINSPFSVVLNNSKALKIWKRSFVALLQHMWSKHLNSKKCQNFQQKNVKIIKRFLLSQRRVKVVTNGSFDKMCKFWNWSSDLHECSRPARLFLPPLEQFLTRNKAFDTVTLSVFFLLEDIQSSWATEYCWNIALKDIKKCLTVPIGPSKSFFKLDVANF